jgi:hypothetical protein
MPLFDPSNLHIGLNDMATELRASRELSELEWEQFEIKIQDMIENVTKLAGSPHPFSVRAQNTLPTLLDAQERITQRSASAAAESIGRASLTIRGGGPTRP